MSAAIAYSIADRPGIAPGLLMGMIANAMGAGSLAECLAVIWPAGVLIS